MEKMNTVKRFLRLRNDGQNKWTDHNRRYKWPREVTRVVLLYKIHRHVNLRLATHESALRNTLFSIRNFVPHHEGASTFHGKQSDRDICLSYSQTIEAKNSIKLVKVSALKFFYLLRTCSNVTIFNLRTAW